jgi:hypothetical protein
MAQSYHKPPQPNSEDGTERKVGLELEFTGIEMADVAQLISQQWSGSLQTISEFEYQITDTPWGTFQLELDAQLFKNHHYLDLLSKIGITIDQPEKQDQLDRLLKDVASGIVPYEIITPPIPWSQLHNIDWLVKALREHNAEGTKSSFIHAFGLHINPEVPSTSPKSILQHLRAFMLLEPWIRRDAEIDTSRKLTPYIQPFDHNYIQHVLDVDYDPNETTMIRDYLRFGNTRNRSLDLLPLFKYINAPLVMDYEDDARISARPAYHYRLPNCSLSDPNWSIAEEWNRWILVEKLANQQQQITRLSEAYLHPSGLQSKPDPDKWVAFIDQWAAHA